MLQRLLLQGIHFLELILESRLHELLSLGNLLTDGVHFLNSVLYAILSQCGQFPILVGLLFSKRLNYLANLRQATLDLLHQVSLPVERCLLISSMCSLNQLQFRVYPALEILIIFGPLLYFTVQFLVQGVIHLL